MIGASERRTIEFLNWESRGRGHALWPHPVWPEPLFEPFGATRRRLAVPSVDDGRKETFLSRALRRSSERLAPSRTPEPSEVDPEKTPSILVRDALIEIQAQVTPSFGYDSSTYAGLFGSLSLCAEPLAFELVATSERITAQFALHPKDERLAIRQCRAFLPDVEFASSREFLAQAWGDPGQRHAAFVEFGLGKEFMIPLRASRGDPYVGVIGALEELEDDEIAILQVIFSPTRFPWADSMVQSVSHGDGSPLFVNAPELFAAAKDKASQPLFAVVLRLATRSLNHDRSWEIACNVASALGAYGSAHGNELVPLQNEGYPHDEHEADLLARQTHRSGMILSVDELVGFAHLPSSHVRSERLRRVTEKTKAAPAVVRTRGISLGNNSHGGAETPVRLSDETRVRHIHVVGASGTGKSTLLFNLIRQDIESGYGCSVLDPHGDLIDKVLGAIPEDRVNDVVLLDPSDEEFVVGFNILAAHSDWEKNLLASDLVSVFRRLSTSWGDQLNSVLSNALLAFMESDRGGTLLDVRRFLLEPGFRAEFLKSVRDPNVSYYWQRAFPALTGNKSVGPVVTRLDTFLSPKTLRYMVAQKENRIDFGDIIGTGKIFLAKLSEGFVGKENSHLLGSFLVSKIQSAAMARQRQNEASRRHHTLYLDEFHNFLTPSLAECLSGVRKYRLGLVLAHQEMRQVERDADVASALLNAGTRIVFRVGDRDARALECGFSYFEAHDIQNLEIGRAICRVERSDWDFNLAVEPAQNTDAEEAGRRRAAAISAARARYGKSRPEVEEEFKKSVQSVTPAGASTPAPKPEAPSPAAEPASVGVSSPPPTPVQPEKEEKPIAPAADLGKGGAQHKAVQERIKEETEKLGFRVVVEYEIPGVGQIDLVLARDGMSVACEISVTGTIDYEVGNVSKCLKAGFTRVAVVAVSEEKLGKLSAAVSNSLGTEKAKSVSFYLPDAFIASLSSLPKMQPAAEPETRTRGGRVVKRKLVPLSPEEAKAKEEKALKTMAALMRAQKREPSAGPPPTD